MTTKLLTQCTHTLKTSKMKTDQQPEQHKTAENNIDSVLLSSFPNQGTRFDSINDVISELGEFGYECVTEAMRKYASQQTASLQKQVEELRKVQANVMEAFAEYASHRKDKGSATMKIRTWNNLVFKIDSLKALNPQDNQSKP